MNVIKIKFNNRISIVFTLLATIFLNWVTAYAVVERCNSVEYISPSSKNNNIKFIFDKPYSCGQFANGDWWVSSIDSKDVVITSITPEVSNGLNGYEINPTSTYSQSFDSRIAGYVSANLNNFPISVKPGSSLVKSVSVSSNKPKCRPCLQFSAVLTITASPIRDSTKFFRPSYFGVTKELVSISSIDTKDLISISAHVVHIDKRLNAEKITNRYRWVQLDHIHGWQGRSAHPVDNMPDYGARIATNNAESVLRLLIDDIDFNKKTDKHALINYLQMAIDLKAMALNGVVWPAAGGHGNGRKLPLLFAMKIFNDRSFLDAINTSSFSEDNQIYVSSVTGKALYGQKCSEYQYWNPIINKHGPRDCRDPYGYIDGGIEIGGSYQHCCTAKPWKYTALAISLLNLKNEWKNKYFFDYVERWVTHGAWSSPDPCTLHIKMSSTFSKKLPPSNIQKCEAGPGRFLDKHGNSKDKGHYSSLFADSLWKFYSVK